MQWELSGMEILKCLIIQGAQAVACFGFSFAKLSRRQLNIHSDIREADGEDVFFFFLLP